jgi:hypothetical protein
VKNKEFGTVLDTIKKEFPTHMCFVKEESPPGEAWLRYEFCLKDDRGRSVRLAVLCFHFLDGARPPVEASLAYLRDQELAGEKLELLTLSEDYLRAGGRVCTRRVVQAGYSLGAILKLICE